MWRETWRILILEVLVFILAWGTTAAAPVVPSINSYMIIMMLEYSKNSEQPMSTCIYSYLTAVVMNNQWVLVYTCASSVPQVRWYLCCTWCNAIWYMAAVVGSLDTDRQLGTTCSGLLWRRREKQSMRKVVAVRLPRPAGRFETSHRVKPSLWW